jgi:hypothetical protein
MIECEGIASLGVRLVVYNQIRDIKHRNTTPTPSHPEYKGVETHTSKTGLPASWKGFHPAHSSYCAHCSETAKSAELTRSLACPRLFCGVVMIDLVGGSTRLVGCRGVGGRCHVCCSRLHAHCQHQLKSSTSIAEPSISTRLDAHLETVRESEAVGRICQVPDERQLIALADGKPGFLVGGVDLDGATGVQRV